MSIYDFTVETNRGEQQSMQEYKGKVMLIVNTASKCGHTHQYEGLQKLYEQYKPQGLEILAFPSNQFIQEPGTNEQIRDFCSINFGVTFPLFKKIKVNGFSAHPLFVYLTKQARNSLNLRRISWNFTKFLVDRNGRVVKRYKPATLPEDIAADIEKLVNSQEV